MDWKGVEEFIAENDSVGSLDRWIVESRKPTDPAGKIIQRFTLPLVPAGRRLNDGVFHLLEQFWPVQLQPVQDVGGEPAIVCASFHNPQSAIRNPHFIQPSGEPAGEKLAEQFAGADAGEEVAAATGAVFLRFVIAKSGLVKRQFHEVREGQDAVPGGFVPDDFDE